MQRFTKNTYFIAIIGKQEVNDAIGGRQAAIADRYSLVQSLIFIGGVI